GYDFSLRASSLAVLQFSPQQMFSRLNATWVDRVGVRRGSPCIPCLTLRKCRTSTSCRRFSCCGWCWIVPPRRRNVLVLDHFLRAFDRRLGVLSRREDSRFSPGRPRLPALTRCQARVHWPKIKKALVSANADERFPRCL